jgi:hypothetical protein
MRNKNTIWGLLWYLETVSGARAVIADCWRLASLHENVTCWALGVGEQSSSYRWRAWGFSLLWCFFFCSSGDWSQGLVLYHLSHSTSPFCIGYFWDRVSFYARAAWIVILLFELPCRTWMTDMYHYPQLLIEMGVSRTFCLGWPQTLILPISASLVARITGVSHHTWPCAFL